MRGGGGGVRSRRTSRWWWLWWTTNTMKTDEQTKSQMLCRLKLYIWYKWHFHVIKCYGSNQRQNTVWLITKPNISLGDVKYTFKSLFFVWWSFHARPTVFNGLDLNFFLFSCINLNWVSNTQQSVYCMLFLLFSALFFFCNQTNSVPGEAFA